MREDSLFSLIVKAVASFSLFVACHVHASTWQPTKNVEFVVPAGTGGGAD